MLQLYSGKTQRYMHKNNARQARFDTCSAPSSTMVGIHGMHMAVDQQQVFLTGLTLVDAALSGLAVGKYFASPMITFEMLSCCVVARLNCSSERSSARFREP